MSISIHRIVRTSTINFYRHKWLFSKTIGKEGSLARPWSKNFYINVLALNSLKSGYITVGRNYCWQLTSFDCKVDEVRGARLYRLNCFCKIKDIAKAPILRI